MGERAGTQSNHFTMAAPARNFAVSVPVCRVLSTSFSYYRDGLERITVDAGGTIGTLRQQISSDLNMPREHVTLSKDQKLVRLCAFERQCGLTVLV